MLRSEDVPKVDTRSANILMNAFAKEGDPRSCYLLLNEMLKTTKKPSKQAKGAAAAKPQSFTMLPGNTTDCGPNVVTYNTLLDGLMRAGDLDGGKGHMDSGASQEEADRSFNTNSLPSTVSLLLQVCQSWISCPVTK